MLFSLLKVGLLALTPLTANVVSGGAPSSAVNERALSILKSYDDRININDFEIYSVVDIGKVYSDHISNSNFTLSIDINNVVFYLNSQTNANVYYWDYLPIDSFELEYNYNTNSLGLFVGSENWFTYSYEEESNRLYYEDWGTMSISVSDTVTPLIFGLRRNVYLPSTVVLRKANTNFSFSNTINRFGCIGGDDNNSLYPTSLATFGTKHVFSGLFYDSLGNLYKGIDVVYTDGFRSNYIDFSTGQAVYVDGADNDQRWTNYLYMNYVLLNGETRMVNKNVFVEHNNEPYITNYSVWVEDNFRYIHIISEDILPSGSSYATYTGLRGLSTFNSGYSGINAYSGIGSVTNIIFTGLSGLTGLFGLNILPGISLGILIFLPLIFSLLLFILKLFKR